LGKIHHLFDRKFCHYILRVFRESNWNCGNSLLLFRRRILPFLSAMQKLCTSTHFFDPIFWRKRLKSIKKAHMAANCDESISFQIAGLPKDEVEIEIPPPRGSKSSAAKKKVSTPGQTANSRVKPPNSSMAVAPITPTVQPPTTIPGSTATTTVPLPPLAQHNSLPPHSIKNQNIGRW
jgi:hypothetical protein